MKKSLLLIAAAAISLSANADWYVVGNNVNGSQQWGKATDNVMSEVSDGVFEWKGTELGGTGFKINNGSWNDDDTNMGSNGEKLVVGTPYTYGYGDASRNIEFEGKVVNPIVTLDRNAGTITVKGAEEEVTSWEVYLAGEFNEYSGNDAAYKFTESGDGIYTLHLDSFDSDFKVVSNGSWYGYTLSAVESGVEYTLYDSGYENSKLTGAATDVTFKYNAKANTLVVTYRTEGGVINPPVSDTWEVYLAGEFNEYSGNDAAYKFTEAGDGIYTLHLDSFDSDFKVVCNGSWYGYTLSSVESGVEYTLYDSGYENSKLTAAATDVTFKYNAKANTLVVTYRTEGGEINPPVVTVPEALYLIGGTINSSSWAPAQATPMVKNGNVFEVAAEVSGAEGTADCYFSFLTVEAADWDEANNADRWGASSKDEEITFDTPASIVCYPVNVSAMGAESFKLTLPSADDVYNCVFTVDFSNKTVKVVNNGSTGVAAIVADEAPVYFNLQGVKVAEPANGIYVKVANGKATKVVINK